MPAKGTRTAVGCTAAMVALPRESFTTPIRLPAIEAAEPSSPPWRVSTRIPERAKGMEKSTNISRSQVN